MLSLFLKSKYLHFFLKAVEGCGQKNNFFQPLYNSIIITSGGVEPFDDESEHENFNPSIRQFVFNRDLIFGHHIDKPILKWIFY